MSQVKIQGNPSGTGTFTIAAPNSNTDRTLTLPDNTGTVLTDQSIVSSTQIASALNASGSAPIYACRAWVNFNGTGTVAIRASGNVTSITDNGTGDYTVNFTTAMADANYATALSASMDSTSAPGTATERTSGRTSSSFRFYTSNATTTLLDSPFVSASFFR